MPKKHKLIAIAAVALDGTIGIGDKIPWRIPEDFKHFRDTTMGSLLIVGSVTCRTLPEKAFEGREYIVLNGGEHLENLPEKVYQFSEIDTVMLLLKNLHVKKVFVAGGASIYKAMIDYCNEAIITWVDWSDKDFSKDNKKFPVGKLEDFNTVNESAWMKSKTGVDYKIVHYKRK
jgi:dihydrofolate reductase